MKRRHLFLIVALAVLVSASILGLLVARKPDFRFGGERHPTYEVQGTDIENKDSRTEKNSIGSTANPVPGMPDFTVFKAPKEDPSPALYSLYQAGLALNDIEIAQREFQLAKSPSDLSARIELLGAYALKKFTDSEIMEKYNENVFWLIEHNPLHPVHETPMAELNPLTSPETFLQGRNMWKKKLAEDPDNVVLLRNAGNFLLLGDPKLAIKYFRRGKRLQPDNPEWSEQLSFTYSLHPDLGDAESEKIKVSALEEIERAISLASIAGGDTPMNLLDQATDAAWAAGDISSAKKYALQLVTTDALGESDYVHKGHQVLGRIALAEGDFEGAKKHMFDSIAKTDGPVLNSFGPRFELAQELLEAGGKEPVLEYLDAVSKFWDPEQVSKWRNQIVATGTSSFERDFSGNEED